MDYRSLERPDLPVLFFRASCDLGYAVDPHKGSLATTRPSEPIFVFLCEKSAAWMDARTADLAGLDYGQHVTFVRELIEVEMRRMRGASKSVYQSILASLRPRTPLELATDLKTMGTETHRLVGQAITQFGALGSVERWARCGIADLRFVHGEPGPTRCTFDGPRNDPPSTAVITVRIGSHIESNSHQCKGALRVYFNLRFYFFHEYLSHAFSASFSHRVSDASAFNAKSASDSK